MTRGAPKRRSIYFERPTVGPRHYVAKGPSGWAETFSRATLDAELASFLGAAPVIEVVEMYVLQHELSTDKKPEDWHTVIGFLGRLLEVSPLTIPSEVGIAFWGCIELARRERGANG